MTIEELIKEEKDLLSRLSYIRARQRKIYTDDFIKKTGVNIGDEITWIDGKQRFNGIVSRFGYSDSMPRDIYAFLINKDGKAGKREARIWSYSLGTIEMIKKA